MGGLLASNGEEPLRSTALARPKKYRPQHDQTLITWGRVVAFSIETISLKVSMLSGLGWWIGTKVSMRQARQNKVCWMAFRNLARRCVQCNTFHNAFVPQTPWKLAGEKGQGQRTGRSVI